MADQTELLRVADLAKRYGSRAVLQDVSFSLRRGERVAVMGPSGCGKTTLLNCLGAVDRPDEGSIVFDGVALTGLDDNGLNDFRREKLGFIFQFFHLMPTLTVYENIELPLLLAGKPAAGRRERVESLLEAVDMVAHRHKEPGMLSGGEMQRVAIARALALRPALLLADEPTGNLDETTGKRILELLAAVCEETGAAMLMVTHSREAAAICSRALRLKEGRLAAEESLASV